MAKTLRFALGVRVRWLFKRFPHQADQPAQRIPLACPVPECRAKLEVRDDRLVCTVCGRRYPFEERWPVLIPEEAEPPEEADA